MENVIMHSEMCSCFFIGSSSFYKMTLLLALLILQIATVRNEVIEVADLALYHLTPENDVQLRYLNRMRTSDSGMIFIHGVGTVGETIEVIASPTIMEHHDKDLDDMKLEYTMKFNPVTIEMFNNETLEAPVSTREHFPELPARRELMEIEPIVPPGVYSGIFLRISSIQRPEADVLSFSIKMNSTMGNPYLCLSTDKTAKVMESAKQWLFESTEYDGYYALRNRKIPNGYVTWEDDDDQVLVIETRAEFQPLLSSSGKLRHNVLFRVNRSMEYDKGRAYEIAIIGTDHDDKVIKIDTKLEKATGCVLLRRGFKDAEEGGSAHLFKIQRQSSAIKTVGHMENFKYAETPDDLFARSQKEGSIRPLTSRQVFNHGEEPLKLNIEDIHERLDKFHLKFQKQMDAFDVLWVPPGLSIGTTTMSKDPRVQKGIHPSVKLNKVLGKDTVVKVKYLISGGIQVPAWSSAHYTVVYGWLNNVNLGFEAKLRITGKADRMMKGRKPKVIADQPVNFRLVNSILRERGFKLENSDTNTTVPQAPVSPPDENAMWYEMPIFGNIFALTLGIKGEIEVTTMKLSSDVNSTCLVDEDD